jgi:hypothetical protein
VFSTDQNLRISYSIVISCNYCGGPERHRRESSDHAAVILFRGDISLIYPKEAAGAFYFGLALGE